MRGPRKNVSGFGSRVALCVVVALIAVLLYAASVGPAMWLMQNEYIPTYDSLSDVYAPLGWASERSDIFDRVLRSYVSFWWEFEWPKAEQIPDTISAPRNGGNFEESEDVEPSTE